jgi:tRNA (mo5U34)-methyltransferase
MNGSQRTSLVDSVQRGIGELGPWYQNLRIRGVETAPRHFLGDYPAFKWSRFAHVVPEDLHGWTVLDIGCNAGFYAMEMKRRGADRVVGIDNDPRYLKQAVFAAGHSGLDIEYRKMSVFEIAGLGERFDLVVFMGVLYHLRHPLLALDLIHEHVAGNFLLFQTLQRGIDDAPPVETDYPFSEQHIFEREGFPRLSFIEHSYSGDPTNWFIPNRAAAEALLRSSGFAVEVHPEPEVYWCRKTERPAMAEPPPRIAC